jgi:type IV secretory pathway VirB9-like protein
MRPIYIILLVGLLLIPTAHAAVFDKKSNTGKPPAVPSTAEQGQTKMVDPMKTNLRAVQEAFDISEVTANVAQFEYNPNETYKVRTRVGMITLIHLDEVESIKSFLLGNQGVFEVSPIKNDQYTNGIVPNLITVKPIYPGVDSNMTIISESGRVYNFYLRSDPIDSWTVPHLTVYVQLPMTDKVQRFLDMNEQLKQEEEHPAVAVAPEENPQNQNHKKRSNVFTVESSKKRDYLKTLQDTDNINTEYRIFGHEDIQPWYVYDDGNFTYFDYRHTLPSDRMPVLYKVVDGYDTVVNFRQEKGFLIAESLSTEGWTLRNGKLYVCVKPMQKPGTTARNNRRQKLHSEYDH